MEALKISIDELIGEKIESLKAGDRLLVSGTIFTARDAAHKRMCEDYQNGEGFPFEIKGSAIYYAGPCPAKPGEVIGSCGPTTAGRMDAYTLLLLDNGLKIMIGKGARDKSVVDSIIRNNAIYLGAIGGAGALIAQSIKKSTPVAYADLGTEAILQLEVEEFPCTVLIDSKGNDIYKIGIEKYKKI